MRYAHTHYHICPRGLYAHAFTVNRDGVAWPIESEPIRLKRNAIALMNTDNTEWIMRDHLTITECRRLYGFRQVSVTDRKQKDHSDHQPEQA